jgi:hypothetical protein
MNVDSAQLRYRRVARTEPGGQATLLVAAELSLQSHLDSRWRGPDARGCGVHGGWVVTGWITAWTGMHLASPCRAMVTSRFPARYGLVPDRYRLPLLWPAAPAHAALHRYSYHFRLVDTVFETPAYRWLPPERRQPTVRSIPAYLDRADRRLFRSSRSHQDHADPEQAERERMPTRARGQPLASTLWKAWSAARTSFGSGSRR